MESEFELEKSCLLVLLQNQNLGRARMNFRERLRQNPYQSLHQMSSEQELLENYFVNQRRLRVRWTKKTLLLMAEEFDYLDHLLQQMKMKLRQFLAQCYQMQLRFRLHTRKNMYPQQRVTKPTVFSLLISSLEKTKPTRSIMEYIAVFYSIDRFYCFFLLTVVNVEKFFNEMRQKCSKKGDYD